MSTDAQIAHAKHSVATTATAACTGAAGLSPDTGGEGKGGPEELGLPGGAGSTGYVHVSPQGVTSHDVCATRLSGCPESGVGIPLGSAWKRIIPREKESEEPAQDFTSIKRNVPRPCSESVTEAHWDGSHRRFFPEFHNSYFNVPAMVGWICWLAVSLALAIPLSTLAVAQGVRERCEAVEVEHTWGTTEKNAWTLICANPRRDTMQFDHNVLDGELSASFVADIVLNPTVTPFIPRHGIDFNGLIFTGDLNLSYAAVNIPLRFRNSRFDGQVELTGSEFTHIFIIENSTLSGRFRAVGTSFAKLVFKNNILGTDPILEGAGNINLANAELGGDFAELAGNNAASVYLNGSSTQGELFLSGTNAKGTLDLVAATVGRSVFMEGVHVCPKGNIDSVSLVRASVGDSFSLSPMTPLRPTAGAQTIQTKLCSRMTMAGAQIKGRVVLEGASLTDVDFRTVTIGGDVSVSQSIIKGKIDFSAANVARNVHMERVRICPSNSADEGASFVRATIGDSVNLRSADVCSAIGMARSRVNGQLDFTEARIGNLDLSAATVGRELLLAGGDVPVRWNRPDAKLNLDDAVVGTIVDSTDAWPGEVSAHGFRYEQWRAVKQADGLGERVEWLLNWLPKGEQFDVQPYEQVRSVLERMFLLDAADSVKFQQWEQLRVSVDNPRYVAWTLARWITGYGTSEGFLRLAGLICAVTALGMLVVLSSTKTRLTEETYVGRYVMAFVYSLQQLLPFAKFTELKGEEIMSGTWRKYYFLVHSIIGYILAGYATASLVLLTNWNS